MDDAGIVIVGGGLAGLSTGGALKRVGLEPVILDQGERVGQSWEQRYERLHLHTVRDYSGLAHFPISRAYPKYLSKEQYAGYLRDYAAHFGLNVVARTAVQKVRQETVDGGGVWVVDAGSKMWLARVVVIATGQYHQPVLPDWPGLDEYGGEKLHSGDYRTGGAFRGKRVLVIGAGNSGMEIAADLAEQGAARVAISVRSGPPVVPRDFLGVPAQVFGILMNALPPAVSDRVGGVFARLAFGDLRRFGLPAPAWGAFASHRVPVIDVGFVRALKAGKIDVRPGVRSFTASGVIYQDGGGERFDAVICATGFRTGLEQLLEPEGLVDANGIPRFPSGAPTICTGLYFMGFYDSLRGFMYESNIASRRLAREIKAKYA